MFKEYVPVFEQKVMMYFDSADTMVYMVCLVLKSVFFLHSMVNYFNIIIKIFNGDKISGFIFVSE